MEYRTPPDDRHDTLMILMDKAKDAGLHPISGNGYAAGCELEIVARRIVGLLEI